MCLRDKEGAGQSWKRREDGYRDRDDRREKDVLAQACPRYRKSQGSVFSGVLRNAVENTLIFRTSNLLHCKTVDLCCFIPELMVIHNKRH